MSKTVWLDILLDNENPFHFLFIDLFKSIDPYIFFKEGNMVQSYKLVYVFFKYSPRQKDALNAQFRSLFETSSLIPLEI